MDTNQETQKKLYTRKRHSFASLTRHNSESYIERYFVFIQLRHPLSQHRPAEMWYPKESHRWC